VREDEAPEGAEEDGMEVAPTVGPPAEPGSAGSPEVGTIEDA